MNSFSFIAFFVVFCNVFRVLTGSLNRCYEFRWLSPSPSLSLCLGLRLCLCLSLSLSSSLPPLALLCIHMGGCQNLCPFLGTLNIRCRTILGTQKGTIILTTTHMFR